MVTDLLGVPVSQVAMGRSHTCVLTQHGVVYTFGNNSFGQCGRNYQPPQEEGIVFVCGGGVGWGVIVGICVGVWVRVEGGREGR